MTTHPIAAITATTALDPLNTASTTRSPTNSFAQMLLGGLDQVNRQVEAADAAVTTFALDDSIAPHQVMFALQQSHNAVSMMMQVRARLVEGYQELMRTQL